jgi:transcription elongation factor Elf1
MTTEFSCSKCRSQSVSYPTLLTDEGHVTCRNCGALLGTLAQFRRIAERASPAATAVPTTGC